MAAHDRYQDDHDDCTGDAAAYVLGALDNHEVAPFLIHLDACAICRDEVASLQVVADMLASAATPTSAPRALRRRVLGAVYEEAELFAAAGTQPAATSPRRRNGWRLGSPFQALAAGALVAAGVAVGAVALDHQPGPTNRAVVASTSPPTTAVLRLASGRTELDVANLPAPTNGRVYEVWLQRRGESRPTDALFTPTTDGHATVAVPGSLRGIDAVAVTDEPAGGSSSPTRAPVITASLL